MQHNFGLILRCIYDHKDRNLASTVKLKATLISRVKAGTILLYANYTHLSPYRLRAHVSIANGCHGDCGPPERSRDTRVLGVRNLVLGEEGKAGED